MNKFNDLINKEIIKIESAIKYAYIPGNITAYNCIKHHLKEKTVVAFGLGKFFEDTCQRLFELADIQYVSDNNPEKWGGDYYGKQCISPNSIAELENPFVIVVMGNYIPVRDQMRRLGIPSIHISEMHFNHYYKSDLEWLNRSLNEIKKSLSVLSDEQSIEVFTQVFCNKIYLSNTDYDYQNFYTEGEYFSTGIWSLHRHEYFVDGGAYIGDTITDFLKTTQNQFEAIYSFEFNSKNYNTLSKQIKKLDGKTQEKIITYPIGIWNQYEESFCDYLGEPDGTQISTTGESCILNSLDSVLNDKKVTTIKLDIEGAELNGLEGAKKIIHDQKPKLAICLYHRPEDLWEIPLKIKEIRNDYQIFIRHHSIQNYTDTVCYAY